MARKKKVKKVSEKERNEAGFVLGYKVSWIKTLKNEHPDYEKVKKEAKKLGLWD